MDSQWGRGPRRRVLAAHGGGRMRFVRRAIALLATVLAVALAPTTAHATDPLSIEPAIDRGVTQLEGAQLPDGGFAGRLSVRDSATLGEALRLARPESPAITGIDAFLSPLAFDDVDSLARVALGSPSSGSASALLGEQNDDGGFGLSREYRSDPLNTALALRALTALGERDAARRTAERLLRLSTAGAWGEDGGEVSLTGEALLALSAYVTRYRSSAAIDTALGAAIAWLVAKQQDGGGWSPDALSVRDTALALAALALSPAAVARVSAGADAVLRAQLPDGSWGDPFSTALSIRALQLAREAIERGRTALLPDPSVRARDLSASPQVVDHGKPVGITATVTNTGVATARGVTAEFFLDDPTSGADPLATVAVPELATGAHAAVNATLDLEIQRGRARVYVVLRAPADQDRDLANNSAFINVYRKGRGYERVRDWPRAGRDIQHSGTTPNRLHAGIDPDPIWRVPADGGQVAAEGKVYFGEDGRITAVDAKTGAFAWQRGGSYEDDRYRPPIYNRGFIYTAEEGQTGALNARTGEPAPYGMAGWGGSVPWFSVEVIPQAQGHDAVFMEDWDFMKNWELCFLKPIRDPTSTMDNLWRGVTPFLPSGYSGWDGYILLGHPCDGQPPAFASDGPRGFATNAGYLTGFHVATGKGPNGEPSTPLFDVKLPEVARTAVAPLVDSLGQVVVAGSEGTPWARPGGPGSEETGPVETGRGRVVAVDPDDGSVNWSFATDTRLDGTPVEYRGAIIAVDRSGRVYALDQVTGVLRWSWQPTGYTPPAVDQQGKAGQTLALSGRYLYVPHPDGHLYTLDARDGSELSATMFDGRPYDLAIDDTNNAIYVRTLDGQLGAYPTRELPSPCGPDPVNGPLPPGDIDRVSFEPDGSQLTGAGAAFERPAISADGRYVAFTRDIGPPHYSQLYVRDLETGETTALPATDEDIVRYDKHAPVLSADGRYLGFVARQRYPDTYYDSPVMLVLDRETGVTEPVLENPDGSTQFVDLEGAWTRADWYWENPPMSISGDGQTIAFASQTNGIVPEDDDNSADVFVVNRATGSRTLVSRTSDGQQVPDRSSSPALSRDGRYVAFTSDASLTGAPIATELNDRQWPYVHLYDMATGELTAVSATDDGTVVGGRSPYVSGDGRFVTFTSSAPSLIPPAARENYPWWANEENSSWLGHSHDAFVFDRLSSRVEMASMNDSGEHNIYGQQAARPVMSDDGRYVAFHNTGVLVKGVSNWQQPQIIAHDRTAGTSAQVSHDGWDVSGMGSSLAPVISADGTRIAFISTADNLVDGDTNNARDVFVYDRSRPRGETGSDPPDSADGCPVPGFEAPGYSDLSVAADDVEPSALEQGQPGQVEVTVHNTGGVASEATTVRLYDGNPERGTLIGERPLGQIAAGASTELPFAWDPVGDAGRHTLTVVVDPGHAVFEQDTADNTAEKPVDVVAPRLAVSVDPDKPAYGANEPVDLAARLTNSSVAARDARVVVSVRDADGDEVATVHDGQVHIEPNGHAVVNGDWNTRDATPGRYEVSARLLNMLGEELDSATSSFEIEPDLAAGLSIETDQLSYDPGETATIGALVSNQSANDSLTGARVELSLRDPGGLPLDGWDLAAGDVMQGRSALLSQQKRLSGLDPGTYDVSAKLLAADGTELRQATAEFTLRSSADTGDGVRGSLTASPPDPQRFSTATLRYSMTNGGNADIPGVTVRVRISDLDSGEALKTLDETRTITRDEPSTGSLSTVADMVENRDYQASLHLVLADGSEQPLDRAVIHVRPAPLPAPAPQPPLAPQPPPPPPPDPTVGVPNACVEIRPGTRRRSKAVPGGGVVLMTVRQSDDPAVPLRIALAARRGVSIDSATYSVGGRAIPGTRTGAGVPLGRLRLGARNRISSTITLANKRKVTVNEVVTVLRCPLPPATCQLLSGGTQLKCSSSMPLRARTVKVSVVGAGPVTATGSARVTARKGARKGTYTLTMKSSAPMQPGRYLYKHVATTRRKGEKLLATRILTLK